MSREDTQDGAEEGAVTDDSGDVRERLEREADRAIDGFDEGVVDLLSWVLDTETRARIYVYLRQHPDSTSDEVADGTGLYPSTVREALAELHAEGKLRREKRESSGAGNNPYEYSAIAPSDLVADVVEDVQAELNTVFNLDRYLGDAEADEGDETAVTITVRDGSGGDVGEEPGVTGDAAEQVDDQHSNERDAGGEADP